MRQSFLTPSFYETPFHKIIQYDTLLASVKLHNNLEVFLIFRALFFLKKTYKFTIKKMRLWTKCLWKFKRNYSKERSVGEASESGQQYQYANFCFRGEQTSSRDQNCPHKKGRDKERRPDKQRRRDPALWLDAPTGGWGRRTGQEGRTRGRRGKGREGGDPGGLSEQGPRRAGGEDWWSRARFLLVNLDTIGLICKILIGQFIFEH